MPPIDALTVCMITKNEAANLPRSLGSVRELAAHLVVVDSGSTDDTVATARDLGADVTVTEDWPGFAAQKNRALERASTRWVLSLDADEWVTEPLADEIRAVLAAAAAAGDDAQRVPAGYLVPRLTVFEGRELRGLGLWHPIVRLFQRERGRFGDRLVHEAVELDGPTARLRHPLHHEPYQGYVHFARKQIAYAEAGAIELGRRNRRASGFTVLGHGLGRFFRDFVLKGGFRYGLTGFLFAAGHAYGAMAKYAERWYVLRRRRVDQGDASPDDDIPVPDTDRRPEPPAATTQSR